VQEEMTHEALEQKRALLDSLEKSEMEARRIEQYLHGVSPGQHEATNTSNSSRAEDVESIDSADFPPTHSEAAAPPQRSKSVSHGRNASNPIGPSTPHKKSSSFSAGPSGGGFLAKGFGKLNYAIHGIVDVDPERTRRDNIGKTRETLAQLEAAEKAVEKDVEEAGKAVLKDLRRFQKEKVTDLKEVMRGYAKVQIEWAKKNLEGWEEAQAEVNKIQKK